MAHFKTVLKNSSYLMGFRILSRIMSLVFLVYAATKLGPAVFGVLSFVLVTVEMLNSIGDLGIARFGARELVRGWGKKELLAGQILVLQVLTSLPFLAIGVMLVLVLHPAYPKFQLLLLGLAAFFLYSVIGTTESVFTARQQFIFSASFTFLGRLIYIATGIVVLATGRSVILILAGYLAATIIEASARLAVVVGKFTSFSFRFRPSALWPMILVIIPFAIVGVASTLSYRINLMILEFIKGDVATGVYNIAFSLYTPFVWLTLILSTTIFPGFTEIYMRDRHLARLNAWQWYRFMALAGIPLALLITMVAKPILSHFPAGYEDSAVILMVMAWSMPPVFISTVDINILQASDHQRQAANGPVLGAVATVLLSFLMIPFFGGTGAALAALASVAFQEVYFHWQVRRHVMERVMYPLLLRPLLGGVVMGAVTLLLLPVSVWLAAPVASLAYVATVFATRAVSGSEIKSLVRG